VAPPERLSILSILSFSRLALSNGLARRESYRYGATLRPPRLLSFLFRIESIDHDLSAAAAVSYELVHLDNARVTLLAR